MLTTKGNTKVEEPKVIYFVGLDRSGKTTTRKRLAEITGEKYITFDRSYIDNLVYDEVLRGKRIEKTFIKRYFNRFSRLPGQSIVFIDISPRISCKRALETEGIEYDVELMEATRLGFLKYLKIAKGYGIEVIIIKPGKKTQDGIAKQIVKTLEKDVSTPKKKVYNSGNKTKRCIASKEKKKLRRR